MCWATSLPLSVSLPIFENFGLKVIAEDAYPVAFKSERRLAASEAAVLDFLMERADGSRLPISPKSSARWKTRFMPSWRARRKATASTGWSSARASRGATSPSCAPRRNSCARPPSRSQPGLYGAGAGAQSGHCRAYCRTVPCALRSRRNRERKPPPKTIIKRIELALNDVPSLDDDRIIRRLRNVIANVLRTNFYQPDESGKRQALYRHQAGFRKSSTNCRRRARMVEIFVYSPQVEGVHLRFGKVARGGIRWSDRREDFRTEVLGLVKAQQVKNAVIVPVGAKGGFYPKQLPANAHARRGAGGGHRRLQDLHQCAARRDRQSGARRQPSCRRQHVVRHDGDDPYLVVAADKGTATFSDIANGIAEARGFWLGDAFASRRQPWLRPQENGHHRERRLGSGQAPFPRAGPRHPERALHLHRRRRHVGRCVRQRHAAVEGRPSWSPRSTIAISSSIPIPIPRASWAERKRIVRPAALELGRLRQSADLQRRRRFRAHAEGNCAVAGNEGADRAHATTSCRRRRSSRRCSRPRSICCGSAASAPSSKPATQNNLDVGDRANDAVRVNGGGGARQGGRRRRQSGRHPTRPHRICAWRAGASTPMRSTIPPAWTPPTTK